MSKSEEHDYVKNLIDKMEGYIDKNGMFQLKNKFFAGEKIPPHGKIFRELAAYIEETYGETGMNLLSEAEGRKLHQLRMYIDRHNILYIRNNFKKGSMTDEDALEAYVRAPSEKGGLNSVKMLREPARLHNKYPSSSSYRKYQKGHENKKRLTPDFHSEFIIDRKGAFVSQWNVLEEDERGKIISDVNYYRQKYLAQGEEAWEEAQRQIMDTESFNYASKNDKVHQRLDIEPPRLYDTELRKQIAREWKSPCKHAKALRDIKNRYCYRSDKGDGYSSSNS